MSLDFWESRRKRKNVIRPGNHEGDIATTFEDFPQCARLPEELQINIFEFSLQSPRVKIRIIRRVYTNDRPDPFSERTYKFSVPPVFQVSRLYRAIYLPFYPSLAPGTRFAV